MTQESCQVPPSSGRKRPLPLSDDEVSVELSLFSSSQSPTESKKISRPRGPIWDYWEYDSRAEKSVCRVRTISKLLII